MYIFFSDPKPPWYLFLQANHDHSQSTHISPIPPGQSDQHTVILSSDQTVSMELDKSEKQESIHNPHATLPPLFTGKAEHLL